MCRNSPFFDKKKTLQTVQTMKACLLNLEARTKGLIQLDKGFSWFIPMDHIPEDESGKAKVIHLTKRCCLVQKVLRRLVHIYKSLSTCLGTPPDNPRHDSLLKKLGCLAYKSRVACQYWLRILKIVNRAKSRLEILFVNFSKHQNRILRAFL